MVEGTDISQSEVLGVHQSDVIVRSALIAGINVLRANPILLDYAFASLPRDELTAAEYGEAEVRAAKRWFQNTNISVYVNVNPEAVKFPCVTISLLSSNEQEQEDTLADIHYKPTEDASAPVDPLVGPLDATSSNPSRGSIVLDPVALGSFVLAPGMVVVTKTGAKMPIVSVTDNVVVVTPFAPTDLSRLVVEPAEPAYVTHVESAIFRESYAIGCHVDSEPVHLTYLHSLIVFILLFGRQQYLEARGFERSTVSSTDFKRVDELLPEMLFSRFINVTGTVRQSWPKLTAPKISRGALVLQGSNVSGGQAVAIADDDNPFGTLVPV